MITTEEKPLGSSEMLLYSIKYSYYYFFWATTDKNCKVLWIYIFQKIEYLNSSSTLCNFHLDFPKKKAQTGLYYEYLLLFYFT